LSGSVRRGKPHTGKHGAPGVSSGSRPSPTSTGGRGGAGSGIEAAVVFVPSARPGVSRNVVAASVANTGPASLPNGLQVIRRWGGELAGAPSGNDGTGCPRGANGNGWVADVSSASAPTVAATMTAVKNDTLSARDTSNPV